MTVGKHSASRDAFIFLVFLVIVLSAEPARAELTEDAIILTLRIQYENQSGIRLDSVLAEEIDSALAVARGVVDSWQEAGSHKVLWNAGELPSGIYFVRMTSGVFSQVRKVVVLR